MVFPFAVPSDADRDNGWQGVHPLTTMTEKTFKRCLPCYTLDQDAPYALYDPRTDAYFKYISSFTKERFVRLKKNDVKYLVPPRLRSMQRKAKLQFNGKRKQICVPTRESFCLAMIVAVMTDWENLDRFARLHRTALCYVDCYDVIRKGVGATGDCKASTKDVYGVYVPPILKTTKKHVDRVNSDVQCCICLETPSEAAGASYIDTACGHTFCRTCITRWSMQSHTCPVCRAEIAE